MCVYVCVYVCVFACMDARTFVKCHRYQGSTARERMQNAFGRLTGYVTSMNKDPQTGRKVNLGISGFLMIRKDGRFGSVVITPLPPFPRARPVCISLRNLSLPECVLTPLCAIKALSLLLARMWLSLLWARMWLSLLLAHMALCPMTPADPGRRRSLPLSPSLSNSRSGALVLVVCLGSGQPFVASLGQ